MKSGVKNMEFLTRVFIVKGIMYGWNPKIEPYISVYRFHIRLVQQAMDGKPDNTGFFEYER